MDVPNWRRVLPVLLNHRSPGVSPGTWESRAMSPTGYPGYPTPLRARIEPGPRRRSSVRIGPCRINLSREASEELPEARQIFKTPLESELSGRIRLERSDLASNQGPEGIGVCRDRDVRVVHAAVEERRHVLVLQQEMKLRPVLQFDQDRLRQFSNLRAQGRIGRDLRVEFRNQALEHLPHAVRRPNSSSLWFRDSASKRRAVSHEARVCSGNEPCARIQVSKNAIVSASEAQPDPMCIPTSSSIVLSSRSRHTLARIEAALTTGKSSSALCWDTISTSNASSLRTQRLNSISSTSAASTYAVSGRNLSITSAKSFASKSFRDISDRMMSIRSAG